MDKKQITAPSGPPGPAAAIKSKESQRAEALRRNLSRRKHAGNGHKNNKQA